MCIMSNFEEADNLAVDFLLSLFIAAVKSYRYDSVLRPFPRDFIKGEFQEKDIDKLRNAAFIIPSVSTIMQADNLSSIPPESLALFKWVLSSCSFTIQSKNKVEFSAIKRKTGQVGPAPAPNYVFEVLPSQQSEIKFQSLRNGHAVIYAYHGSRLENFHSILHNGLVAHLNKNSLFGSGTYLSSELSVSLHYSSMGSGWDKSILGKELSCVAVCEIIDHPSVKCHTKDKNQEYRSYSPDSMGGKVPEKYYLVQNNDLMRIRYLLVYTNSSRNTRNSNRSWWRKYRFVLLMIGYFVVLLAIGLSTSTSLQNILKKYFS